MWIDMKDDCKHRLSSRMGEIICHMSQSGYANNISLVNNKCNGRSLCKSSGFIVLDFHITQLIYFLEFSF